MNRPGVLPVAVPVWRCFWALQRSRPVAVGMDVVEQAFAYGDMRAAIADYGVLHTPLVFAEAISLLQDLDEMAREHIAAKRTAERKTKEGKQ